MKMITFANHGQQLHNIMGFGYCCLERRSELTNVSENCWRRGGLLDGVGTLSQARFSAIVVVEGVGKDEVVAIARKAKLW